MGRERVNKHPLIYVLLFVMPTQEVRLGIYAKPILWRAEVTGHDFGIEYHLFFFVCMLYYCVIFKDT